MNIEYRYVWFVITLILTLCSFFYAVGKYFDIQGAITSAGTVQTSCSGTKKTLELHTMRSQLSKYIARQTTEPTRVAFSFTIAIVISAGISMILMWRYWGVTEKVRAIYYMVILGIMVGVAVAISMIVLPIAFGDVGAPRPRIAFIPEHISYIDQTAKLTNWLTPRLGRTCRSTDPSCHFDSLQMQLLFQRMIRRILKEYQLSNVGDAEAMYDIMKESPTQLIDFLLFDTADRKGTLNHKSTDVELLKLAIGNTKLIEDLQYSWRLNPANGMSRMQKKIGWMLIVIYLVLLFIVIHLIYNAVNTTRIALIALITTMIIAYIYNMFFAVPMS